jgi:hypothetical protein
MFSSSWEGKEGELLVSYGLHMDADRAYHLPLYRKLAHLIELMGRRLREYERRLLIAP